MASAASKVGWAPAAAVARWEQLERETGELDALPAGLLQHEVHVSDDDLPRQGKSWNAAARLVLAQIGDPQGVSGRLGQETFHALLYWRSFNLLFRAWLRPSTPEGRIAPVDDAAARGLLVALNWVVVLPLIGGHIARALETTGASRDVIGAAVILYAPLISAGLLWVVWHWRNEMTAWLSAMV